MKQDGPTPYSIRTPGGIDFVESDDDNVDVIIALADGREYAATFFTLQNLRTLMDRWRVSGECAHGTFVWAADMIVVERIDRTTIDRAVAELISTDEIAQCCRRIDRAQLPEIAVHLRGGAAHEPDVYADETGQLRGFAHHDGSIDGIVFDDGDEAIVLLVTASSGERCAVRLSGVAQCVVNGLREGNIVDRMYAWPLRAAPPSLLARAAQALDVEAIERRQRHTALFHLECSYGAELFAVLRHGIAGISCLVAAQRDG